MAEEEEGEEPRYWRKEKFSRGIPTDEAFVNGVLPAAAFAPAQSQVEMIMCETSLSFE